MCSIVEERILIVRVVEDEKEEEDFEEYGYGLMVGKGEVLVVQFLVVGRRFWVVSLDM